MPMSFQKFSPTRSPATLSPFSSGIEDNKLYSRSSLGGVFNYGESVMEPCSSLSYYS